MLDGVSVSARSEQSALRSMPSALHLQPASHPFSTTTTTTPVQCSIKAMSNKAISCNIIIVSKIREPPKRRAVIERQGVVELGYECCCRGSTLMCPRLPAWNTWHMVMQSFFFSWEVATETLVWCFMAVWSLLPSPGLFTGHTFIGKSTFKIPLLQHIFTRKNRRCQDFIVLPVQHWVTALQTILSAVNFKHSNINNVLLLLHNLISDMFLMKSHCAGEPQQTCAYKVSDSLSSSPAAASVCNWAAQPYGSSPCFQLHRPLRAPSLRCPKAPMDPS